jgi:hypothetical protein
MKNKKFTIASKYVLAILALLATTILLRYFEPEFLKQHATNFDGKPFIIQIGQTCLLFIALICTIFAFIFTLSISIIAIILGIVIILAICAIVLFLINGIINLFGFENIGDPKKLTQNIRLILSNFEENLDGCEKETDLPIENIVAADAEDGDEDESEDEDIYTVKTKEEMISLLMGALLQLSLGLAAATAIPAVIWDLWFIH